MSLVYLLAGICFSKHLAKISFNYLLWVTLTKRATWNRPLYIFIDTSVVDDEKLQLQRLMIQLIDNDWSYNFYTSKEDCFGEFNTYPLILVGYNREIIGYYELSIEEVDRVLVEFDLLNHLREIL